MGKVKAHLDHNEAGTSCISTGKVHCGLIAGDVEALDTGTGSSGEQEGEGIDLHGESESKIGGVIEEFIGSESMIKSLGGELRVYLCVFQAMKLHVIATSGTIQ